MIDELHKKLFAGFTYIKDSNQWGVNEDWRSHYEDFKRVGMFMDDCDGFAFTAADAVIDEGLALPGEVLVIRCLTEVGRGNFDHMVCGVNIGTETWILDNRYPAVYLMSNKPLYKWYDYMDFNDKGSWYKIEMEQ